jgi:hypothetical protein
MLAYDAGEFIVKGFTQGWEKTYNESLLGQTINAIGDYFDWSDERLKENIVKTGVSKSGIPTYEFNYKNDSQKWEGAMAQDLLSSGNADSVVIMQNGYYGVNYDNIDVDMKKV